MPSDDRLEIGPYLLGSFQHTGEAYGPLIDLIL